MVALSDILIFDRSALRVRRRRAAAHTGDSDFLLRWTQEQLTERLGDIRREFPLALRMEPGKARLNDLPLLMDEEFLPVRAQSLDLVHSALHLHSVNDLPGALLQIKRALKPDGMFIGALFGGETLHELRGSLTAAELKLKNGISPRVFPFADKQQMGALLQRAGFALPVVDSEIVTVTYENMFRLMHDLRFMGESNIIAGRDRRNPGKALFMEAANHYAANHADPDGRIRATFEIIFLIGWAPHESQQKPLRPGSAQTHLSEVL